MRKQLLLLTIIAICLATAINVSATLSRNDLSLQALYECDGSLEDNSTYGRDGVGNSITFLPNHVFGNGSCLMNANTDYINVTGINGSVLNSNMTLALWMNTSASGSNIASLRSAGQVTYEVLRYHAGQIEVFQGTTPGTTGPSTNTWAQGSWQCVVITRTTTTTSFRYNWNSTSNENDTASQSPGTSTEIASWGDRVGTSTLGMFDNYALWNRSLSNTEAIEYCTTGFSSLFTISLNDGYTGSAINNFNASVSFPNGTMNNYSTTSGAITTNILTTEGTLANITITSQGYHTIHYSNYNTSTLLTGTATQIFTTITAYNAFTNTSISNFSIVTAFKNYSTTSGSVIANLTNGTTHNVSITSSDYAGQTTSVAYSVSPSNQTLTFYLYPVLNIRLFNETDASAFDPNITTSTILRVFCDNATQQQTLTAATNTFNATCEWTIMRVYVTFGNDTYYRTLKPALTSTTIDFYLINLLTDTAVQKTFQLNDLAGTFGQGSLIFDKIIGTNQITINEDDWDIENKVISYFILYDNYIVELTDNSDVTRVLGPFIADATSNHVISVPTIPLYTDQTIDDLSWGYFFDAENGYLYMNYDNLNGTLYSLNFAIVNATNTSQVFYNNSFNTTSGSVNFTTILNNSIYKTMLTFNHSSWGVHDDIKTWGGVFLPSDDFTGVSNPTAWKLWLAIIIIIIGALVFNGLTTAVAAIWIAGMTTLFSWIGWLNISPYWVIVIGVFALLVVLIAEGVK